MLKKLTLLLMMLIAVTFTQAQDSLTMGQLVTVNISADDAAPSLTFMAEAGQQLNLQLASITGDVFPIFTIYTEDGEILQYVGNPARSAILEAVAVIPLTGSYRLEVFSIDGVAGQVVVLVAEAMPAVTQAAPLDNGFSPTAPADATPVIPATSAPAANCAVTPNSTLAVNVREGPLALFHAVGALEPGQSLPVNARDPQGDWYRVNLNGVPGWVAASVTRLEGECSSLEVVTVIIPTRTPTPTNTPTATFTPTPTPTRTPTPTAGFGLVTAVFSG